MAGILDTKTRFIDLVVTQEGKRQIASGKLRAEFASLTDSNAFYDKSESIKEAGDRIYFQAMEKPEDVFVIEKDDSGILLDFNFASTGTLVGENIFAPAEDAVTEDLHKQLLATGSQFSSLGGSISDYFLQHFKKNQFVTTKIAADDISDFELSDTNLKFTISNSIPFKLGPNKETINVNQADHFLLDPKLTSIKNFQYLPPVNTDGSSYGIYKDLRNTSKETFAGILSDLGIQAFSELDSPADEDKDVRLDMSGDFKVYNRESLIPLDSELVKEYNIVDFRKTSLSNNMLIQIFEQDKDSLKKLDIVDAGVFYVDSDPNNRFEKRVFYVGKVYFDDYNAPTFINIFTLIFDWGNTC